MNRLHLFLELFTLASFAGTAIWAVRRYGRDGAWLLGFLFALGAVRENFVILERLLYGFADLTLRLGAAPLVAAIIWGFSILASMAATEAILRRPMAVDRMPSVPELGLVALFMVALAGFYEPFLARVELARWEGGTATLLGVPKIALVGYPSFAVLSLAVGGWLLGKLPGSGRRLLAFALAVPPLALAHAAVLQALKGWWGW